MPIIQPLLAYIAYSLDSNSIESIRRAVSGHFTLSDILLAKDILWNTVDKEILGDKPCRKGSSTRSEADAHLSDILQAMVRIDKASLMPCFVVDYKSLHLLPKSNPEELNNISLCDRLNNIESTMSSMQTMLDSVIAQNIDLKQVLNALQSQPKTPALEDMTSHESSLPQRVQSRAYADVVQINQKAMQIQNPSVVPVISAKPRVQGPKTIQLGQSDGFEVPSYHRKKKQPMIIGKGINNQTIKGAPEPSRDIFVCRVDKAATVEEMQRFIEESGFSVKRITIMSHEEAQFKSFKVSIPKSQLNDILGAEKWPEGVMVRRFWDKHTREVNNSNRNTGNNKQLPK
jgi:hypothetical protein